MSKLTYIIIIALLGATLMFQMYINDQYVRMNEQLLFQIDLWIKIISRGV